MNVKTYLASVPMPMSMQHTVFQIHTYFVFYLWYTTH